MFVYLFQHVNERASRILAGAKKDKVIFLLNPKYMCNS